MCQGVTPREQRDEFSQARPIEPADRMMCDALDRIFRRDIPELSDELVSEGWNQVVLLGSQTTIWIHHTLSPVGCRADPSSSLASSVDPREFTFWPTTKCAHPSAARLLTVRGRMPNEE